MPISSVQVAADTALWVTDEGDGHPIPFIHGLACDSSDWSAQVHRFRADHRVIAPDVRGHGRSMVTVDGYDLRTYADDIVSLLDHLAVRSCVLVGHSLGALVAAWLAVEQPDRVRALVALDPGWAPPHERRFHEDAGEAAAAPGSLTKIFEASDSRFTPDYFRESHRRAALVSEPSVIHQSWQGCFLAPDSLAFDTDRLLRRRCLALHSNAHPGRAAWEWTLPPNDRSRSHRRTPGRALASPRCPRTREPVHRRLARNAAGLTRAAQHRHRDHVSCLESKSTVSERHAPRRAMSA